MEELTSGVSWLAVSVGALVSFLAGFVWYTPKLFGQIRPEGAGGQPNAVVGIGAAVSQIVGLFLMSWFVGVTAVSNALLTAILATAAFGVLAYSGGMFSRRSSYSRNADAGYLALCLVVMIICQGIFRGA